jgi:aminopeptidase
MDQRWKQLGNLLVNYSAQVQPGEHVLIAMKEVESWPLVQAVYEASIKAHAFVQVQFLSDILYHSLMRYGVSEQIGGTPEMEMKGVDWADVYFGLRGSHNLNEFHDIPADSIALLRQGMGKVSAHRNECTRWILVPIPNDAMAQQAKTDTESLMDMFFAACLRDWETERDNWKRIASRLDHGKEIRIVGKGTDLSFSIEGMNWAVDAGESNMPGGEIWTAPVTSSLNGCIYFEYPGVLGGQLVPDIRLEWKNGRMVSATASANEDFLHQVVAMDAGSSLLGEFAFGTNPAVNQWCNDILIDEKTGGTIHVALGRAYSEVGGTNQSALHWDIIKDVRNEGAVYMDGVKIFEAGHFTLP